MTLYIANTTKQHWNHSFRVPEMNRPVFVRIESGTQIELGKNWGSEQTECIIRQLEKFGARRASEVSGKLENFPGIFYSHRVISEDDIVAGHEAVVDGQERRSASEATRSALAFDVATRDKKGKGRRLAKVTEVEVRQDIPRNEKPTGKEVNLSISVSEDGSSSDKLLG